MNGEGMNWFEAKLFIESGWAVRRDIWNNTTGTLSDPDIVRWVLFHNNLYYMVEGDGLGGSAFRVVTKEDFGADEFTAKDWTIHPVGCYIQSADINAAFEEFAAGAEGQPFPRSILNPNLHYGACSGSTAPETLLPDGGTDFGSLPNPGPVNDQGWNNNGDLPGAPQGGGNGGGGGGGGGGGNGGPKKQPKKNQAPGMPELTITASLWAVDDVTVIPACISNPSLGGRNKYTYDIAIEMADSDYAPYNEPWWGTFNWAPNMTPDGVGGLSLGIAGEERFSIMPGETHNIIGVDVYLESIKTGDLPNALNSAQFKASAYLPVRRVTTQDTHNEAALPDCSTPPETGGYGG